MVCDRNWPLPPRKKGPHFRQLSLPSTWTGSNHAFPGFLEVRVENSARSVNGWYDSLIAAAANNKLPALVVLYLEPGVASAHCEKLANQISRLATTHKKAFAAGSGKEAVMTQHVVVIMQPPCDALLARLSHMQLWELRLGPHAIQQPAVWHFPGQPPSLNPLRGRVGYVRFNPTAGSDLAMALPARRHRDLDNVVTAATVANGAPAGPVRDAIRNLPGAAALLLDEWFREAHARGVDQGNRERAEVFSRSAPY